MTSKLRYTASSATLQMRSLERQASALMIATEASNESDWPTDLQSLARLTWLEAGRRLDELCERDGIGRWSYRWPL